MSRRSHSIGPPDDREPVAHPGRPAGDAGPGVTRLGESQRRFAAALLDPGLAIPPSLIGPDQAPSARRFNVYRNNVILGLVEALGSAFPAVQRIVGDTFFAAMARTYAALEPPRSPVMLDYGDTFPEFVNSFGPARRVPYLADVARLERAWLEAYHAAESCPIAITSLCIVDTRQLPRVSLSLHPSLRVIRSTFPAVQIWRMNIDGGIPSAIDIRVGGEHAVVVRPAADVEVIQVEAGTATFVQHLGYGASIARALSEAQAEDADFDLAAAWHDLFAIHAVVGWTVPDDSDPAAAR